MQAQVSSSSPRNGPWTSSFLSILNLAVGIGAQVALTFPAHGITNLSLVDIQPDKLETLKVDIKSQSPRVSVLTHTASVTDEAALQDAVNQTVQQYGRIDIAVNSAGINDPGMATHEVAQEAWQRVIHINQTGCWLSERAEIQQMLQQEYGRNRIQASNGC